MTVEYLTDSLRLSLEGHQSLSLGPTSNRTRRTQSDSRAGSEPGRARARSAHGSRVVTVPRLGHLQVGADSAELVV